MAMKHKQPPPIPANVAAVFAAFPERVRARLLEARGLIFETAAGVQGVGPLKETLKWGEPAYLTEATGSGSTIRLSWFRSADRQCAVLFNCRTALVDDFRSQFPDVFSYEKNRAILLRRRTAACRSALDLSWNGSRLSQAPPTLRSSLTGLLLVAHDRAVERRISQVEHCSGHGLEPPAIGLYARRNPENHSF